jgi:photosystem II stability/assembly factor-like uncharacterized protein
MKKITLLCSLFTIWGCSSVPNQPSIELLESPTEALLQAISIVDENTIWISGHDGSFVRTNDGGESWDLFSHPTGDTLQFRDIYAFDAKKAILMSAGPGPLSRIFTFSAPDQWEQNFVMQDSLGFLDCIEFWDDKRGIAYGDAIDNYPYILLTSDGGKSWSRADTTNMPSSGKGEGGFAASGTCVSSGANGKAWIATGANGNCRFLITEDYGHTWVSIDSPLAKGEAAGNTSVSFIGHTGFVTGGDLLISDEYTDNCAFSNDGGKSWTLSSQPITKGAFYGGTITKVDNHYFTFACGPNGLDYTSDLGQTWTNIDTLNYWAVSMKGKTGYASGRDGKILRISLQ